MGTPSAATKSKGEAYLQIMDTTALKKRISEITLLPDEATRPKYAGSVLKAGPGYDFSVNGQCPPRLTSRNRFPLLGHYWNQREAAFFPRAADEWRAGSLKPLAGGQSAPNPRSAFNQGEPPVAGILLRIPALAVSLGTP